MPPRIVDLIRKTMTKAGFPGGVPDYLAVRHLCPKERAKVLGELKLRAESTDALTDMGHHGPNDVIISLDRGLKREVVKEGSRVLLAAAGIGFTYAAALIQWGPA
jgi:3-oxoacyl-[acyl-carrier-protein] synthase-3